MASCLKGKGARLVNALCVRARLLFWSSLKITFSTRSVRIPVRWPAISCHPRAPLQVTFLALYLVEPEIPSARRSSFLPVPNQ